MTAALPWFTLVYQVASVVLAILGFRILRAQLQRNERTSRADFLVSLNKYAKEFTKLHHKIQMDEDISSIRDVCDARDFLRFMETTMLLVHEKVISPKEIFPSLGYRVFTFMNNEFVQKNFLYFHYGSSGKQKEEPCSRHVGAFALYERLFDHFANSFSDLEQGLRHYSAKNYNSGDTVKLEEILYWRISFKNGVRLFYKFIGDAETAKAKSDNVDKVKAMVEQNIKARDSVG